MLFSGTIIFPKKTARCFDKIRRITRTINMPSSLNCSTSFDQEFHPPLPPKFTFIQLYLSLTTIDSLSVTINNNHHLPLLTFFHQVIQRININCYCFSIIIKQHYPPDFLTLNVRFFSTSLLDLSSNLLRTKICRGLGFIRAKTQLSWALKLA